MNVSHGLVSSRIPKEDVFSSVVDSYANLGRIHRRVVASDHMSLVTHALYHNLQDSKAFKKLISEDYCQSLYRKKAQESSLEEADEPKEIEEDEIGSETETEETKLSEEEKPSSNTGKTTYGNFPTMVSMFIKKKFYIT